MSELLARDDIRESRHRERVNVRTCVELKMLRKLFITAMFAIGGVILVASLGRVGNVANRDFIAYWSAGQLLITGENPYDRSAVLERETPEGLTGHRSISVRNPPWALWLMLPLGFFSASTAWVLWMTICIGALMLSIRGCWHLYGAGDPGAKSLCLLSAMAFAPVLACLMAGQLGLLVLAGLVMFLRLEKSHPFWAGVVAIVPLTKPQIFLPLFLVASVWAIAGRKWRLILGFVVALCVSIIPILVIDPNVFRHYYAAVSSDHMSAEFIPSLSGVMRILSFPKLMWVQFLPLAGGLVWVMCFYRNIEAWDWRTHGLTVLVVCFLVAPYNFLPDEAALLPAFVYAALRINARRRWPVLSRAVLLALLMLSAILLVMTVAAVPITSGLYFWSAFVWAAWYWFSRSSEGRLAR